MSGFGLEQIILHDSFSNVRGRTISIPCRGRTHLGGGNGAGKTSTLSLIPAFYGQEPERLVSRTGGKWSFLDYFLPSLQSMIIFEYSREDGLCCAVMFRHRGTSGGQLRYRFVKASAEASFLRDDVRQAMADSATAQEVFDLLQESFDVSGPIRTIKEYRAIIQRTPPLSRDNPSEARNLRRLANQYGMGRSNSQMAHLEKLTNVVLKKNNLMSSFKQMICDTQFQDLHLRQARSAINGTDLANNIRSLSEFDAETDRMRELLERDAERQGVSERIHGKARQLQSTIRAEGDRLTGLKQAIEESEAQQKEKREAFEALDRKRSQGITDAEAQLTTLDQSIKTLYQRRDEYERDGIAELAGEAQHLGTYRQRLQDTQREYNHLTGKLNEIRDNHERNRDGEIEHYRQTHRDLEAKVSQLDNRIQQGDKAHESELARKDHEKLTAITEYRDSRREQERLLKDRVVELETRIKHEGPDDEQRRRLSDSNKRLHDAEATLKQASAEQHERQGQLNQAQQSHLSAVEAYNDAVKTRDQHAAKRDALRDEINVDSGSWLYLLRSHPQDEVAQIARLINPEILRRSDLSPEQIEHHSETVLGWQLNLEALLGEPTPEIALSVEELTKRLEVIDQDVQRAEQKIKDAEKDAEKARAHLNECQNALETAKVASRQAQSEYDSARAQRDTIAQQIEQEVEQRRAQAQQELERKREELRHYNQVTEDTVVSLTERYNAEKLEAKSRWEDARQDLETQRSAVQTQIKEAETEHKQRLKRMDEAFHKACRDEGIDTTELETVERRLRDLKDFIKRVEDSQDAIAEYNRWLEQDWGRLEQLERDCNAQKTEVDRLTREREEATAAHNREVDAIKCDRQDLEAKAKKLEELLGHARKTLSNAELDIDPADDTASTGDLQSLTDELGTLLSQQHKLHKQVKEMFSQARATIQRYHGSDIQQEWANKMRSRAEARQVMADDANFDEDSLEYVEDIRSLLDDTVPHLRRHLIESFRSEAQHFHGYYESLRQFVNEVERVSRKLGSKINLTMNIDSLQDVGIELIPRIHEDEAWAPLNDFVQAWEQWQMSSSGTLPPEALVRQFQQVDDALKQSRVGDTIESLLDMRIHIREAHRDAVIKNDNDFVDASSTGLTYLAIMGIFMSMTRYLCPDDAIRITWPIDELASLDDRNIAALTDMLEQYNLTMLCACPKLDHNLRKFFENKYRLHNGRLQSFAAAAGDTSASSVANYLQSTQAPQESADVE